MMKRGLVSKLLGTFTTIIGISFIILATVLSCWFKNYYFDKMKADFNNHGKLVSKAAIYYLKQEKDEASRQELQVVMNFMSETMGSSILITDDIGIVNATAGSLYSDLKFKKLDIEQMDKLKKGNFIEERNSSNRSLGQDQYVYYKPIFYDQSFAGAMVIITPMSAVKAPLNKVYTIIWVSAIIALLISSVIIYYFSQRILIKPLAQVNIAAKRLAKGDIESRIEINSKDEIGELSRSFNIMADSLKEVEKNRREFISNVSHELRSPITSIKGFIAGILDGVIPKDKENYYLSIVYNEIQRLTRLVNDLLDLSAMEAGKFDLTLAEIDVNEVVKHCVINAEQKIKEKKLQVEVTLEGQHLYASADRDRIVQVVTNLVDNAIKYCVENGSMKISTRTRGNKVLVAVYNDGPAIAEQEIKYIWDRFYKSDKSRTNKVSTGLGLPIVRHILSLHGEDIWVENKSKDFGVTFTFSLAKV